MAEAAIPVKRTRTWLIVLGGLVLLIVIAGMAAMLLIHNKQLASFESYGYAGGPSSEQEQVAEPAPPPLSNAGKHVFSALEMFTANLAERDRDRFVQVGVVLELGDAKTAAAFNAVIPPVRSEILMLLTSKTVDELGTLQGKQRLAVQIVDIARKYIAPEYQSGIYAAHFSGFVIQ
ncbi:flagellar basal body-associated protein FliL [Pigmentiphaga humi]|uniref:Flagellar protein FliL n=1 Tax=Pigmentiphaga humi TaxID=2478468 RepID=A0A3P4B0W5_9BURK|nr:flagellar basal body-associated FliL family protein [Pigmentiphaga humi]VCU69939.1 flagellar basal body-associated protein FliL [Pigmentiphaga humi]